MSDGGGQALPGVTKKKLFDFDESRVSSGKFAPPNKPNSPYIYVDSGSYGISGLPAVVEIDPKTGKPAKREQTRRRPRADSGEA